MDMIDFKTNKKVKDICNGDKSIDIQVILIKNLGQYNLKNGSHITTFLVGDETGCINCNYFVILNVQFHCHSDSNANRNNGNNPSNNIT